MQNTFLSAGSSTGMVQGSANVGDGKGGKSDHLSVMKGPGSHGSSTGFDATSTTFRKRTTSVAKPVDRHLMEDFKSIIE